MATKDKYYVGKFQKNNSYRLYICVLTDRVLVVYQCIHTSCTNRARTVYTCVLTDRALTLYQCNQTVH